jgi:acyl carrier protein
MRLHDVLARVLDEPADQLTDDSSPDNVLNWTSMRHVTLLIEIENAYGIRFTNAEMTTMRSLGDIKAAIAGKGVEVT